MVAYPYTAIDDILQFPRMLFIALITHPVFPPFSREESHRSSSDLSAEQPAFATRPTILS